MPASLPHLSNETLQRRVQTFARLLHQRRKSMGISVQNAASAASMSRDTWYRMERAETTVTIAAWFNALAVLGLNFGIGLEEIQRSPSDSIPVAIRLAEYPQLAALAWQLGDKVILSPKEAFDVYERNARHIEESALEPDERRLIENLRNVFV